MVWGSIIRAVIVREPCSVVSSSGGYGELRRGVPRRKYDRFPVGGVPGHLDVNGELVLCVSPAGEVEYGVRSFVHRRRGGFHGDEGLIVLDHHLGCQGGRPVLEIGEHRVLQLHAKPLGVLDEVVLQDGHLHQLAGFAR